MNRQQRRAGAKSAGADKQRASGASRDAAVMTCVEAGLAHQQAGRWTEAESCYQQALAVQPDHADALHLLGVVAYQTARHDVAVAFIRQAIRRNGRNPFYFFNLGLALKCLGRLDEALASYDRAVALDAGYAEAYNDRGIVLEALHRPADAVASYDRAIALRPDYVDALYNRGNALKDLGRFEAAIANYDRVLALQGDHPLALNNRGNALQALRRLDAALESYNRAVALKPDYIEAFNNRGVVRHELKQYDAALADYDAAIALMPDCVEAFYNRGNALLALQRCEQAVASYDRVLALKADHAEACYNRANALRELGRFDAAFASYRQAQALKPDYVEARWNEACLRLLTGDFARGLAQAECRWQNPALGLELRDDARPLWRGDEPLAGKTILLHADEGLGDAIFYARYVPLLAARGARVVLELDQGLHALMSGLDGVVRCIQKGEPAPDFDLHCPLSSLPLAFGTRLSTIPSSRYLHAPALPAKQRARLGGKRGAKIGIAWSGNPRHSNDRNRSVPLETLSPLFGAHATFVSLQKDVRPADAPVLARTRSIVDAGPSLKSFADTAALIGELDLVISADTSVAHLAGALGAAVWILLPFIPDWRWLLARDDSPWYPSARLFRQDERRDWRSVAEAVRAALDARLATHGKD
jgi:tetratricopeptide (TPR) repeat protein